MSSNIEVLRKFTRDDQQRVQYAMGWSNEFANKMMPNNQGWVIKQDDYSTLRYTIKDHRSDPYVYRYIVAYFNDKNVYQNQSYLEFYSEAGKAFQKAIEQYELKHSLTPKTLQTFNDLIDEL
jgi:hypothetical protein